MRTTRCVPCVLRLVLASLLVSTFPLFADPEPLPRALLRFAEDGGPGAEQSTVKVDLASLDSRKVRVPFRMAGRSSWIGPMWRCGDRGIMRGGGGSPGLTGSRRAMSF